MNGPPLIKKTLALLVAMSFLAAACSDSDSVDSTTPATSAAPATTSTAPPTSLAVTTTAATVIDEELTEEAWSTVVALFAAINAGDDDSVLALFAPSVVIWDNFVGDWPLEEWTMLRAWNTAQGTKMTPPECTVAEVTSGEVAISCQTGVHDATSQAVDGPPVPTTLNTTVTAAGISELRFTYRDPDFFHVGRPFDAWMIANHLDVTESGAFGFGQWTTVAEATENGLTTAQYSMEWATYLVENGCGYLDGC